MRLFKECKPTRQDKVIEEQANKLEYYYIGNTFYLFSQGIEFTEDKKSKVKFNLTKK